MIRIQLRRLAWSYENHDFSDGLWEEPHEIEYIHKYIHMQFPNHWEVHRAIQAAKAQLKGSEDRERMLK